MNPHNHALRIYKHITITLSVRTLRNPPANESFYNLALAKTAAEFIVIAESINDVHHSLNLLLGRTTHAIMLKKQIEITGVK
jgi:hypothetical protein